MKLIIIGANYHALVVLEILSINDKHEIIGFTDLNKDLHGKNLEDVPVLGDDSILEETFKKGVKGAIIGIGDLNMIAREKIFGKLEDIGFEMINVIHPSATILNSVKMGIGNVILPGVIINSHSIIGNNCIIYSGSIIEHNNVIEDHVYISPGVTLGGNVVIKKGAFIGIGATILPSITIGERARIAAGAVVINDIEDNKTAIGVPAKIKEDKNE